MLFCVHLVSGFGGNEDLLNQEVNEFLSRLQEENPKDAVLFRPRSRWDQAVQEINVTIIQSPTKVELAHYVAWHAILQIDEEVTASGRRRLSELLA